MTESMYFGYKHWTLEDISRCFYVGKGGEKRPYEHRRRNHKWCAIVKRYGLRVEVCVGPVSNDEACRWEVENIASMCTLTANHSHDDASDIGCNFTEGGTGGDTWSRLSDEKRAEVLHVCTAAGKAVWEDAEFVQMMRDKFTGANNPMYGRESAMKGRHHTEEVKQKLSENRSGALNPFYGKKHSEETRQKMSAAQKRRPTTCHSDETRQKLSEAAKRRPRRKHSAETRKRMSEAQKKRYALEREQNG